MPRDMIYTGTSMNPTLKAGDGLSLSPYGSRKIRVGDVVVFQNPAKDHDVVHRVIAIDSRGISTRGDNNNSIDPWVLRPDDIIRRVVSIQRKSRTLTVHGGAWGIITAFALRKIKHVNTAVSRILHPAYHWLAGSGIFKNYTRLLPKTRVVSFHRPGGTEYHLLMGKRVIGRRNPTSTSWHIARPFRLFVDETSLPK